MPWIQNALQSCSKLRRRDQTLYPCLNQSLDMGCPREGQNLEQSLGRSVVLALAASVPPGNLLVMYIFGSHPRPSESWTLGEGPSKQWLNKPPDKSDTRLSLRATAPRQGVEKNSESCWGSTLSGWGNGCFILREQSGWYQTASITRAQSSLGVGIHWPLPPQKQARAQSGRDCTKWVLEIESRGCRSNSTIPLQLYFSYIIPRSSLKYCQKPWLHLSVLHGIKKYLFLSEWHLHQRREGVLCWMQAGVSCVGWPTHLPRASGYRGSIVPVQHPEQSLNGIRSSLSLQEGAQSSLRFRYLQDIWHSFLLTSYFVNYNSTYGATSSLGKPCRAVSIADSSLTWLTLKSSSRSTRCQIWLRGKIYACVVVFIWLKSAILIG